MSFDRMVYQQEVERFCTYAIRVKELFGLTLTIPPVQDYAGDQSLDSLNYKEMRTELKILHKGLKYFVASMGHDPENI